MPRPLSPAEVDAREQTFDAGVNPSRRDYAQLLATVRKAWEIIERASKPFLALEPGVVWEGDLANAMTAVCRDLATARQRIGVLEKALRNAASRGTCDSYGANPTCSEIPGAIAPESWCAACTAHAALKATP